MAGINRNIVECKDLTTGSKAGGTTGINRNIVECKDGQMVRLRAVAYRINRNIVECKDGTGRIFPVFFAPY